MMGHTHAVSGAMVWLAGCAGLAAVGAPATPWHVVAGTVICAGAALLPDLDHPSATVARALGPVTRLLAMGIAAGSAAVHAATRTGRDRTNGNGHRALTHTALFAVGLGLLVSLLGAVGGRTVVAVVLTLTVALGLRGLVGKVRGDLNLLVPGIAVFTGALALWVLPGSGWWWLGIPVAVGCLVHDLGDATTNSGCPILWPLLVDGQRWYRAGTPQLLRYAAGSWVEQAVVLPVLAVGAVAAGICIALA